MQRWGAVPATEPGSPTLRSSAPGPNLFAWPGHADLTHIRDEITGEIAALLFGIPLGKKKVRNKAAASTVPLPGGFLRQTMEIVGVLGGPFLGLIAELRCGGHQLLPELKIPFPRFPFQLGRVWNPGSEGTTESAKGG